jgi:uncharacterized protein
VSDTLPAPPGAPPGPGPRQRPNYALRRAVVAVIALAILLVLVLGLRSIVGGGDGEGDGGAVDVATGPSTTEAPTTTTTTPPIITNPRHNDLTQPPVFPLREPPVRVVSEAEPLTIWTIGDSTAQALGQLLENGLAPIPAVDTRTVSRTSTGLTRQDFYDWPAALPALLAEGAPDAVVVSMGDNDAQALMPAGSTAYVDVPDPAWLVEYERRLTAFVDQLTSAGSRVYLVGQPVMRDGTFNSRIAVVDAAYRNVAAADPEITYVDSKALLGDDAGAYTDRLPGAGGQMVQVRSSDGIHLSLEGARWMATVVGRMVAADFGVQAP